MIPAQKVSLKEDNSRARSTRRRARRSVLRIDGGRQRASRSRIVPDQDLSDQVLDVIGQTNTWLCMRYISQNKVDLSTMNEEEKKLFQLYGKLPSKKSNPLSRMQERKYFDSGDYAMSKAGTLAGNPVQVGTAIPKPESIPHASPPPSSSSVPTLSSSPSKESNMGGISRVLEGQHTRRLSSSLSNV